MPNFDDDTTPRCGFERFDDEDALNVEGFVFVSTQGYSTAFHPGPHGRKRWLEALRGAVVAMLSGAKEKTDQDNLLAGLAAIDAELAYDEERSARGRVRE